MRSRAMAKCDGCGLSTGSSWQLRWDGLRSVASQAKRCPTCKSLVALKIHPTLKK
jgi:hypothetical protein